MKKKTQAGTATVSPSRMQQAKTLKQQFIYEVLGQQENFKKVRTKANLTKLITLYRKLVEYYSQRNDKIALYFKQKMSNVSSEMLTIEQTDEKLTMSMIKQISEDDKNNNDPRFKSIMTTTPVSYDPELKKKQRSKNAQIAIQVNKVKKRVNAKTILASYYNEWQQNNKIIMEDLKNQRKQLQDKLLAIHNKSKDVASNPIII